MITETTFKVFKASCKAMVVHPDGDSRHEPNFQQEI